VNVLPVHRREDPEATARYQRWRELMREASGV